MGLLSKKEENGIFSPWEDLSRIGRQMDDWLASMRSGLPALNGELALASLDVEDKGDRWVVSADLPGMERKDIKVGLDGNELRIEGSRESRSEERKKNYVRTERHSGSVRRSVELAGRLHGDKAQARYENGVLTVEIPKDAEGGPAQSRIEVK